jgi:type VI secretion system secreted protein VgrG
MKKILVLAFVAVVFYFLGYAQMTPKKINLTAADEITLITGRASIVLKKDGTISIKGGNISIDGTGVINIKSSTDVVIKGSEISEN